MMLANDNFVFERNKTAGVLTTKASVAVKSSKNSKEDTFCFIKKLQRVLIRLCHKKRMKQKATFFVIPCEFLKLKFKCIFAHSRHYLANNYDSSPRNTCQNLIILTKLFPNVKFSIEPG